jgi:anti-sigma B factor antagonist
MKIKQHERDGIPIVSLSGTLEGGHRCLRLLDVISGLVEEEQLEVVFNMKKVKWIASTGLGILIRGRGRFLKHGGIIRLCELNERSLSLMATTKANLLFEVYDTEDQALAATKATGAAQP